MRPCIAVLAALAAASGWGDEGRMVRHLGPVPLVPLAGLPFFSDEATDDPGVSVQFCGSYLWVVSTSKVKADPRITFYFKGESGQIVRGFAARSLVKVELMDDAGTPPTVEIVQPVTMAFEPPPPAEVTFRFVEGDYRAADCLPAPESPTSDEEYARMIPP